MSSVRETTDREKTPAASDDQAAASLVLDGNYTVMSANRAARDLLSLDLNPGDRLPIEDIFSGVQLSRFHASLSDALNEGLATASGRVRLSVPGEAAARSFTYTVDPLLDGEDRIIGALTGFRPERQPGQAATPNNDGPDHLPRVGYQAVVDNLAEGLFTINTNWRITSFNRTAGEITGFAREEVLGRHCWDIFRSDLCETTCPLRITLENGTPRMDQDVRMMDKGGARLGILVNTSVLRDESGSIIGAVETFRPLSGGPTSLNVNSKRHSFADIIGRSEVMTRLFDKLPDVAASEANVLIQGESGTGKELFARAIHSASPRAEGPFVAVNCSALAESLLESELFGHEKAAFTGAIRSKVGRFELAKGGTIFLDEIGELKPELQVKLLRVLEERAFERVGGTRLIPMQARIISATNRDLAEARAEGALRDDLFYRLRTVPLDLPPLRDRDRDIPLLVEHFITILNRRYNKDVRSVDPKVMDLFVDYPWPGNVRELERVMEHAFVFVKGPVIFTHNLPDMDGASLTGRRRSPRPGSDDRTRFNLDRLSPGQIEREAVLRALQFSGGRREDAAKLLGISRTSLWRKMKAMGLDREE